MTRLRKKIRSRYKRFFKSSSLVHSLRSFFANRKVRHGVRVALLLLLAWLAFVFTPGRESYDPFNDIQVGDVADRDVVAPFDFEVSKSRDELALERRRAADAVSPVLEYLPGVQDVVLGNVLGFFERLESIRSDSAVAAELPSWSAAARAGDTTEVTIKPIVLNALYSVDSLLSLSDEEIAYLCDPVRGNLLRSRLKDFILSRMREGVISTEAYQRIDSDQVRLRRSGDEKLVERSALSPVSGVMDRTMNLVVDPEYPEVSKNLFVSLLQRFIRPNVIYNWSETERLKRLAAEAVRPTRDERVLEQERIISRGERVTGEQMLKLDNLRAELEKRNLLSGRAVMARKNAGIGLIYILVLVLLGLYTYLHRPDVYWRYSKVLLVSASTAIAIVLSGIVLGSQDIPNYLVPVAIAGMLISYLVDDRYALVTAAIIAMIVGIQAGFSYYLVLYALACGAAGALSVRRVESRKQQYMPIIYIFAAAVLVQVTIEFGYRGQEFGTLLEPIGWSLVNATFCTFMTIPLLPLFEYIFGITSNFTLLELSDLNRPILKRLAIEAPGTYHHSIIIGTLAEAAASGIGANPIYARVGGYYHDIGKLRKPHYFIENQRSRNNPHNKLSPKMSSLIIANHVKEGVELARKARLPECLIDIIRQHHGTQSISFFFSKEKEQNPKTTLEEGDFCYPGPKPMSKEAAIIMLADAAESASRTLTDPTVSRIRNLIKGLTEAKMRDGQLDQAELTLRDLSRICEEFLTILIGVHHHRIDYPSAPGLPKDVRERAAKLKAASSGENGQNEAGKIVSAAEGDDRRDP